MTRDEVVIKLKEEAEKNHVAKDVFTLLASRERARHNITVQALANSMKLEGFHYPKHEYVSILKFLSELGFGKVTFDSMHRVRSLTDLKITLQSIGKVALGMTDRQFEDFNFRNRYEALYPSVKEISVHEEEMESPITIGLTMNLHGKTWTLPVPNGASGTDIAEIITTLKAVGRH